MQNGVRIVAPWGSVKTPPAEKGWPTHSFGEATEKESRAFQVKSDIIKNQLSNQKFTEWFTDRSWKEFL